MSRRSKNKRLPSLPEGAERDQVLRNLAGKMATVSDLERMIKLYDARFVEPLRLRVLWLDMPLWKRAWVRTGMDVRWGKVSRWWYLRRWLRAERGEG